MQTEDRAALAALIRGQRQASLGTLADGLPFVSMVLYVLTQNEDGQPVLLIHVSKLSTHTKHLLAEPRASLLIAQPDTGEGDPQALPRVTMQVRAHVLAAGSAAYERAKTAYISRLPQSEFLFTFPDFVLFQLELGEARYVGGFAKAFSLNEKQLVDVLAP
jgi:heme iron utilization protein